MNDQMTTDDTTDRAFSIYPEIRKMFDEFTRFHPEILPSRYWEELNRKNLQQLADTKYENFKRTVARNYFTWIVNPLNKQIRFLAKEAGFRMSLKIFVQALFTPAHQHLKKRHTIYYNILTNLLWDYVKKGDVDSLLDKLIEPSEGNPPKVLRKGRLISQDLANSVLEYKAMLHPDVNRQAVRTILELGPGYGRTAYVFLALQPDCKYVLVDIPPALYVAQRYLTNVFPNRRSFQFRPIDDFEDIREEFEDASIIFLTPNQLKLLPEHSIDLFINISSLHEMRMDQIQFYFTEIERLTGRYFYFKQWQKTTVPFENETIRESNYPVRDNWRLINRQQCEVQHEFFEALYELPGNDDAPSKPEPR